MFFFLILEQVLQNFSQQSGAWHHCVYFMNNCSNQYVLMYAVSVFEVSEITGFHVTSLNCYIPKLKITHPSEVLFSSDTRPPRTFMSHNGLDPQGSSFSKRAHLNFQAFALVALKWPPKKAGM